MVDDAMKNKPQHVTGSPKEQQTDPDDSQKNKPAGDKHHAGSGNDKQHAGAGPSKGKQQHPGPGYPGHSGNPGTPAPGPGTTPSSPEVLVLDMLDNIKQNGFNKVANGLYINWRYGTQPLQTNLNGSGQPDGAAVNPPRHDPLTDLRYLHALLLYKSQNAQDTQFDSEVARYTAIIKKEFAQAHDDRGWLYDVFIDMFHLSKDTFYQQAAQSLVANFYKRYDAKSGLIYKTDQASSTTYYRIDLALEQACALIQEGTLSQKQEWIDAGQHLLAQLYATAYLQDHHTFLYQLQQVVLPSGTINPNPTIDRRPYQHFQIQGGQVRAGAAGQEALSLLHTYQVTHDVTFLNHATDLLDQLTIKNNALGMWDTTNEGYYAAVVFPGADMQNPGSPAPNKGSKEAGRQMQLLQAFHVANALADNRYADMEQALLKMLQDKAYYVAGHGVLYEMAENWSIKTLPGGQRLDWVTTEAMGITLEALLSLKATNPW